jgi:hypothetical protein
MLDFSWLRFSLESLGITGMIPFLQRLWQSPAKVPLIGLLTAAIGILVNHLIGQSGQVQLPATTATDILLSGAALLFSVCGVAYSYWKKCQPAEKVEAALEQGRPICHCTTDGEVMLLDPKQSSASLLIYVCPRCKKEQFGGPAARKT